MFLNLTTLLLKCVMQPYTFSYYFIIIPTLQQTKSVYILADPNVRNRRSAIKEVALRYYS